MERVVTILSSGIGLGVYVPALLLDYRLRRKGIPTETHIVESYFTDDKLERLKVNRKAYHDNFQVAKLGYRMTIGDISSNLNPQKMDELFNDWENNRRRDFMMISGHWHTIMDQYIERVGAQNLHIDAIRMDSDVAPSWKTFTNEKNHYREIWLFDSHKKDLPYRISVGDASPAPFKKKQNRLLIHGGGWGMGTYQTKIKELNAVGFALSIAAYEKKEAEECLPGNRYFLMDPDWAPWYRNAAEKYDFPPTYEVGAGGEIKPMISVGYHAIFDQCMECKAIVSKPGGGTLLDSLASATPVIFIDPIAKHEQTNAALWQELGFGISYGEWAAAGYSASILERLHETLLRKNDGVPDYVDAFIKKYGFDSDITAAMQGDPDESN